MGSLLGSVGCDLCAVYNASAARGETTSGFHLTLAEQFTHSKTLQKDGVEVDDPAGQYRNSSITTLIAGYNFNRRFGMSLNIPFIYRSFKRVEGMETEKGTESGFGDISLLGRYFVLNKSEHKYSYSLSLLGGVEFPTGDSGRLKEEVGEVETPGQPEGGVHGNDLALGSGSFDAVAGLAASARWKRFYLSADAQYFIRTQGDFDYRYGNELTVAGGPGFYLLFKEETTLSLQALINYESKARDRIDGEKRNDGIVTAWYLGPGIVFTQGERFSATLNLDLPLDIENRAVQTVPDYRLRAGVSWSF